MKIVREVRYVAYASGNLGKNLLWSTADLTLLFMLTDLLGLPAAMAGAIFLAGLIFDAALTLLVGIAAQRVRGPFSHYGLFILPGAPVCALAFVWLYGLPLTREPSIAVIAAAVLLFRAAYAVVDVPHNALIAALGDASRTRSRIAGYRFGFSSAATLAIATTIPALTATVGRERAILTVAIVLASVAAATLWLAWAAARHGRVSAATRDASPASPTRALVAAAWANANLRRLLAIVLLTGLAPPLFAKGLLYYSSHVLRDPTATQLVLIGQTAGQLVAVPLWIWLASVREKATVLAISHGVAATGLLTIWAVEPHATAAALLGGVVGAGLCGIYMLPWAMAPDIVDEIDARSGHRPEALLFALLILVMKVGIGLGAAAFGGLLDLSGYAPAGPQPPPVRQLIANVTCLMPAIGCLLLMLLTFGYRLTHAAHADVVAILRRR